MVEFAKERLNRPIIHLQEDAGLWGYWRRRRRSTDVTLSTLAARRRNAEATNEERANPRHWGVILASVQHKVLPIPDIFIHVGYNNSYDHKAKVYPSVCAPEGGLGGDSGIPLKVKYAHLCVCPLPASQPDRNHRTEPAAVFPPDTADHCGVEKAIPTALPIQRRGGD